MYVLDGIMVADFTTNLNGAYATMLLSDMGADVIKIEPFEGDPFRATVPAGFMAVNRGKRSIAVNLRKTPGKEIVHKVIAASDFVVENARWGVWHKLGFDHESVVKIKPDIIYVSILGHGSKGPHSSWPAFDALMQCRSGQMVAQGGIGKPPVFARVPINDQAGPMLGAYGAMLALFVRAKTGKGQHVETSMINASIAMQSGDFIDYPGMERKYLGDADIRGLSATNRHYQTEDCRWVFVLCPHEQHWVGLCRAMKLETLLSDPRFETPKKRAEHDEALVEILSAAFRGKSAAAWIAALQQAGVPIALGQTVEEVLSDPHCLQTNVFTDQDHPQFGHVRLLGVGPRFSEMSGVIRRHAPLVGQHTDEVLTELGYAEEQIAELKANRIVLSAEESS